MPAVNRPATPNIIRIPTSESFIESSESLSPGHMISRYDLPTPDLDVVFRPVDNTKKSHARKRDEKHTPRPRNAFILFRSAIVHQNKVPKAVQSDHCAISRHAGELWRQLTDEQRAPWNSLAEEEKKRHAREHPTYTYRPGSGRPMHKRTVSRNQKEVIKDASSPSPIPETIHQPTPLPAFPPRRSSSCPPYGSEPVRPITPGPFSGIPPAVTRDDLTRRPSRTIMYRAGAAGDLADAYTFPYPDYPESCLQPAPLLTTGPYRIPSPHDAPGWDAPPPMPTPYNHSYIPTLNYQYDSAILAASMIQAANISDIFTNANPFLQSLQEQTRPSSPEAKAYSPLDTSGRISSLVNIDHNAEVGGQYDLRETFPRLSLETPEGGYGLEISSPGHFHAYQDIPPLSLPSPYTDADSE